MLTAALRGHCCCSNGRAGEFTAAEPDVEDPTRNFDFSAATDVAIELGRPRQVLSLDSDPSSRNLHRKALGRSRAHDLRVGSFEPGFREPKGIEPHEPENRRGADAEGCEGECFESRHLGDLFL